MKKKIFLCSAWWYLSEKLTVTRLDRSVRPWNVCDKRGVEQKKSREISTSCVVKTNYQLKVIWTFFVQKVKENRRTILFLPTRLLVFVILPQKFDFYFIFVIFQRVFISNCCIFKLIYSSNFLWFDQLRSWTKTRTLAEAKKEVCD